MISTYLENSTCIGAKSLAFVLLSFLFSISIVCFSQGKQANNWYFGYHAAITFNEGAPPVALTNNAMTPMSVGYASATISDTLGQLEFYTNGTNIWNRNHELMFNGEDVGYYGNQGSIIIPYPENYDLYYLFNASVQEYQGCHNLQYSLIDMNLDNGNGAVVSNQKSIYLNDSTSLVFTAVYHKNQKDIWLLSQKIYTNEFSSYLITSEGLDTVPVVSYAGNTTISIGHIKFSPDGSKVCITGVLENSGDNYFEILEFNNETGEVNDSNTIVSQHYSCYTGPEFSPNNDVFYIYRCDGNILQYDLTAGTPSQVLETELSIYTLNNICDLQLGPDGKIYICQNMIEFLHVIHDPNTVGVECNFGRKAVQLAGINGNGRLPIFLQSFFSDPEFSTDKNCFGDSTHFELLQTNGIDSVFWKFNDFQNAPNDTSTLFNPTYLFSAPGTYSVELTAYSNLLQRTTTQIVHIYPNPQPDLGEDTILCDPDFSITLNPNWPHDWIDWSTGQINIPEIIVSDTGLYWVNVIKDGCASRDSIQIDVYPQTELDTANMQIIYPGCGYSNGSISGIEVSGTEPLLHFWLNDEGNIVAQTLDADSLSAGTYSLVVTDGNACTNNLANFTLIDDGAMPVDSVLALDDQCTQAMGSLQIFAPQIGAELSYSIDSGYTWQQNGGIYDNLSPGSYYVMVKDENDCSGTFADNPVILQNIPGPTDVSFTTQEENNYNQDGQILLQASIQQGDLHYSIDSGNNFQNNGLFTGLSAGTYYCVIMDDFGCDTTFEIILQRTFTTPLEAIAGDGNTCMGDVVVSPLLLDNFTDVKSFNVKLNYDSSLVQCDGYINLSTELEAGFSASIIPHTGDIYLEWEGENPLTLPENSTLTELVFTPLQDGATGLNWDTLPNESVFLDQDGAPISVQYKSGEVRVYENPKIQPLSSQEFCQGDTLYIDPNIEGGNGQKTYTWSGPQGFTSSDSILYRAPLQLNQAGTYTLIVTDILNCQDESSLQITVNPQPIIAFSDYDTLFVEPGYELNAGSGQQSYLWNTGATTEYILIDSTGEYFVQVTSFKGCTSTDTVQILWSGEALFLANAFTPNGDGMNDEFKPVARYDYVQDYHLLIFNRWGQLIFESTDLYKGWDGKLNGKPAMSGTYVYRIDYREPGQNGESHTLTGTVVLVR